MAVHLEDRVNAAVQTALRVLALRVRVVGAFVFGSHVEGVPDEESDIDLAVFVEGAERWDFRRRVEMGVLVKREAGDNIDVHFFPATALEHSEPASFATYVKTHGVMVTAGAGA